MTGNVQPPAPSSSTDPDSEPVDTKAKGRAEKDRYEASQSKLVWRAFRRHRLAMAGAIVVIFLYLVALFTEFLAPFSTSTFNPEYTYAPPQQLHVVDTSDGDWDWGLYVNGYTAEQDPETLEITFEVDESEKVEVGFFEKGEPYELWGLFEWDRHLISPKDPEEPMYLLGADKNGRDVFSRMIHGTRVSMSIGLVGVAMSFVLGIVLGGISGYFGGRADTIIQRLVEFFMSIPTLPLWLGLAAALPQDWGPLRRYFAITVILAIIAWTGLAREVRGRFLSLREEDFVTSAHLDGNSQPRVIFRHMLPSFTSHLIAQLTLSIPAMILAETSLSFLGLGLQPPVVSWGVLLEEAQQVRILADAPWIMIPGLAVIVAVLALNFAGDGLRDAADPYKR